AADSDPPTAKLAGGPAHGPLTFNADGSFAYTPNAGFSGMDSFSYTASDGFASSGMAMVTLNVHAANQPPTATGDGYSVAHNDVLLVAAPGVLGNDTDPDGDPLTAVLVSGPSSGTLSLSSDGSLSYTPAANFAGTATFTHTAHGG